MSIVKELNLNKNPNVQKNGSFVFSKNIKVSPDGSYVTNEEGLSFAFDGKVEGKIVGIIPCNKELVILSYLEADTEEASSHIYRCSENVDTGLLDMTEVFTAWIWNKGDIVGDYTYNVNNELIIAIGEYGVNQTKIVSSKDEDEDSYKDVVKVNIPLKTINLNRASASDNPEIYSVCPNIPVANLTLEDKVPGTIMPNGIYQFFIRYEIDTDYYTNWFPIGTSYFAINLENKTIINHVYDLSNNSGNIATTRCSGIYNNDDKDCNYNFKFAINFDTTYHYKSYQIGYILKHQDTTLPRIWRKFSFDVEEFIFDANNFEETSVDELVSNSFNMFNVSSLCNYENRLYVTNYDETDYNEKIDRKYIDNIKARIIYSPCATENNVANKEELYDVYTFSWSTNAIFSAIIERKHKNTTTRVNVDGTNVDYKDVIIASDYKELKRYLCWIVSDKQDISEFDNLAFGGYSAHHVLPLPNVAIAINKGDNPTFDIISVPVNGKSKRLYDGLGKGGGTDHRHTGLKIANSFSFVYDNGVYYKTCATYRPNRFRLNTSSITRLYSSTINIEDAVKTLMPDSVYNFFIHYVRKDGTYTNGYQLSNDKLPTAILNSVTMTGSNTVDCIISNITSLKERISSSTSGNDRDYTSILSYPNIKDKMVFELVSNATPPTNTTQDKAVAFGYYKNYNKDLLFKTGSTHTFNNNDNTLYRIKVGFTNIEIPDGFIGFFFSYEKPEVTNNYQAYCAKTYEKTALFKASEVEVGKVNYNGSVYIPEYLITDKGYVLPSTKPAYINNANIIVSNGVNVDSSTDTINAAGSDGGIVLELKGTANIVPSEGEVGNIITFNRNIYCKKDKELISFGPVCYKHSDIQSYSYADSDDESNFPNNFAKNYDFNYPAFYVNDKTLIYNRKVYISDTGKVYDINDNNSISKDWTSNSKSYAKIVNYSKFSRINTNAISIKKEPDYLVGVLGNESSGEQSHQRSINYVVKPINATDLIELKDTYIESNHKVYTNYKDNLSYDSYKRNTIRRSDVIGDESLANAWRHFQSNNYKVVSKAKGSITNIVGVGNAFFVHTEHSLFYLNRENLLKTEGSTAQLKMPDLFEVEPIELFTSNHGFGGLQNSNAWTVNSNGYWFVDADNRRIYNFDNNKLNDLSSDIIGWLRNVIIDDATMVTDFENNRVICCIKYHNEDVSKDYITLSFDIASKHYISLHDYKFSRAANTKNKPYFYYAVENSNSSYLYCFHKNARLGDYQNLSHTTYGFPTLSTNVTIQKEDGSEETKTIMPAIFDVIFNEYYSVPKCINSISYILNKIYAYGSAQITRMAEQVMGNGTYGDINHFSGNKLRIYTDSNDTGDLDISTNDIINNDKVNREQVVDYKHPYFDKGVWNFNYIRNYISKELLGEEIAQRYGKKYSELTDNEKIKVDMMLKDVSDQRNLVYGRYFVTRFLFDNVDNIPFKFEDININYSKY
uniref:Stabilization protein n=1 Tax=Geladintestivirus 4 TaxID=3233136 RepID=A0AAU8MHD5_9CAUD